MTTRITHMKTLPKNVEYWDYYILCRLDDNASMVLQRMEYWDGTKAEGNIHAEQINDQLTDSNQTPTQDTSRFVYKTSEELSWEMIGACNEKTSRNILDLLTKKLKYLVSRHNPYNTFDRTKQYAFQEKLVQEHLDKLYNIVKHFQSLGRQQRPVLYAIEQLTSEGVYVNRTEQEDGTLEGTDLLSIELVTERLKKMHEQMGIDDQESQKKRQPGEKKHTPLLPTFIKFDLKKDEQRGFSNTSARPSGKFTGSNNAFLPDGAGKNDRIDEAKLPDRSGKNTGAIPVTTTVTTNNDYFTEKDNVVGESESTNEDAASAANTPSPSSQEKEPTPPTVTETSTVAPVVAPTSSATEKQEENATQQNEQPKKPRTPRTPNVEKPAPAPLVMPTQDAKWCAETAVQIVEFTKKRHYSETTGKQELTEAKKLIKVEFEGSTITREQFENAWNEMVSWAFWEKNNIAPMIKHLRKDDKIVTILNSLKTKKSNNPPTEQPTTSEEKKPLVDYNKTYGGLSYFKPGQIGRRPASPVTKAGK